jgi:putative addiction module component (TIGR02574 family)
MSAQEIMQAALKLSPHEREIVGEALLESVGHEWSDLDMSRELLEKRLNQMKSDPSKRVPLEEVFPELLERED